MSTKTTYKRFTKEDKEFIKEAEKIYDCWIKNIYWNRLYQMEKHPWFLEKAKTNAEIRGEHLDIFMSRNKIKDLSPTQIKYYNGLVIRKGKEDLPSEYFISLQEKARKNVVIEVKMFMQSIYSCLIAICP